jgi:NAD(P)-dependent dehydrogenase (short-subunit alcohol dehydrogenase family)
VTGCSRGIGLEVARMLLADGWEVVGVSRGRAEIEHERFSRKYVDLCLRPDQVEWLAQQLENIPLDALIHCAAIQGPVAPITALVEQDMYEWEQCVTTNLIGTYRAIWAALPSLHQSDDARILLYSGVGAFNPRPNYSAYAASKRGVVALMECLSDELRETNVTVNCIAPGYVPTTLHGPDVKPDKGEAMAEAVACVRHMLSPATRGLSGKTVSAPHDGWRDISPLTVARVNASVMGTTTRHPIQRVAELARLPAAGVLVS